MSDTPTESIPSPEPFSERGELLGRYRVVRRLGRGGMGEVYLAEDRLLHRKVALKRVRPDRAERVQSDRHMLTEARRAGTVNHPGIASVYDVFEWGDGIVIVMEYVEGRTIRAAFPGVMDPGRFWDVARQIVGAVSAAHARGVIHRDLKPENVMITEAGRIKILDFGVAKRVCAADDEEALTTETHDPRVKGTPSYMAPEALLGHDVDARADVFSLGVFFYEMLGGRRPFDAGTRVATVNRVLKGEFEPLASRNPHLSPALTSMIERMIAREPERRFANAEAVEAALDAAQVGDTTAVARGARGRPRVSRRGVRPILAALALAAVVFLGVRVLREPGSFARHLDEPNVAVLPVEAGAGLEDDTTFLLGAIETVTDRLTRMTIMHPFQIATTAEVVDEDTKTPAQARARLGANVVLATELDSRANVYSGRMSLLDTESGTELASRTFESDESSLPLIDALTHVASELLDLPAPVGSAARYLGTDGAGSVSAYLQGMGELRLRENGKARAAFELALDIDRRFALAHVGLGWCSFRSYFETDDHTDLSAAMAAAREAITLEPDLGEAYRLLGYAWSRADAPDSAAAAFRRATALNPADYASFLEWGRVYGRRGDTESEERIYRRAVEAEPHGWRPLWSLAALLYNRGRFDEAHDAFEAMVARVPDYYRGHAYLGGLYVQQGDYAEAVESLERSIALHPTEDSVSNLGTAYFNQGDFEAAIRTYNQAFQYGFDDYMLWINLGDAYYWSPGRRDEAAHAYRRAIAAGTDELAARPYDVWILGDLAPVYARLDEPDSARAVLGRALRVGAGNPNLEYNAALTYWELGARDSAMVRLQRAVAGGFPMRWIGDSPVFAPWREMPEFARLVDEHADITPANATEGGR